MDAASPDKASTDPSVAIDVRVEEDGASADRINSTEGQHKGHFPRNEKSTYCVEWRPVDHPKDL